MKKPGTTKQQANWSVILLVAYTTFLVQGIMLPQVLCYKTDGSVNLETAFMGLHCECSCDCSENEPHHQPTTNPFLNINTGNLLEIYQLACTHDINDCRFDVPINENLLRRTYSPALPDPSRSKDNNCLHEIKIPGTTASQLALSSFRSLPGKFPVPLPLPSHPTILLC